jgi:hypothetical protein
MEKTTRPGANSQSVDLRKWWSLTGAFRHIEQVEGYWQLAGASLLAPLKSGDVSANDHFLNSEKVIEIRPLTRKDWEPATVMGNKDGVWFSGFFPLHGHNIFLCRADVLRYWPGDAVEPGVANHGATTRRRRPGPKPEHDWKTMATQELFRKVTEAGKAHDNDSKYAEEIEDHIAEKTEDEYRPPNSQLRALIGTLPATARRVPYKKN